jgi:hypothetical protein
MNSGMETDNRLFSHEFSTGNRRMLFGAILSVALAAVVAPIGLAHAIKEFLVGSPAGLVGLGIAAFVVWCSFRMTSDWFHPKKWSIELSEASLTWRTPDSSHEITVADIKAIELLNGFDMPRLSVTKRDGQTIRIHPNCLGDLARLAIEIRNHFPEIRLEFSGSGAKAVRT